jgi:hypothetical protein
VDFDRYTTDQQFLGLKSVVLRNNVEDASNLHERISMLLFRRLGLPAPREAHTALYVNNEYVGLYTIVESIDKSFLNRTFGEQDGYLYEFEHSIDKQYRFEYLGSNPDLYVPVLFKPETHETDPRPEVIERLAWTINETSDAVFRQSIAEYLDLSRFVRHVAVEMFVADNDAILGNWGMNNFYFYRFVNRNLFTFVAWDRSEAFKSGASFSVFHNINDAPMDERNRLMIRALTYPDLYAAYVDALLDCVRSASEPETGAPGGSGWLEREIEREYQQIRAAALIDPLKPFSNDEFEQAVGDLRLFAQQRAAFVLQEVERTRPPSRIRLRTTTRAPQP